MPWWRFWSGALVDGEGEIAAAEQLAAAGDGSARAAGLELLRLGAGIAAQRAGVGAVGEQHRHGAVALGLHAERAAEFQRRGERRRQRQRLAESRGHGRMVVVAGQQRVGERAEPDQAAAHRPARQVERRDAARHDDVGHRRAGAVEEGGGVGHRPNIGSGPARVNLSHWQLGRTMARMSRPLLPEDADRAADLIRTAFAAIGVAVDPPPSALGITGEAVRAHLEAGGGGALHGGAGCILWSVRDGGLYVSRLAVLPDRRGRGSPPRCWPIAEAVARHMGMPRIHLEVRLALEGNRLLFRRAGFVEGAQHAHPGFDRPTYVAAEKRF